MGGFLSLSDLIFEQAWLQIAPRCRALAGRPAVVVQGCKERQLACLRGSGGGQLCAPQFKNVLPAVKFAVDDDEGRAERIGPLGLPQPRQEIAAIPDQ
jgi:hypothetical protein